MSRRIRHLIMCFLLLALPVQGWAVVTMLHCGSSHQAMAHGQRDAQHHHSAGPDSLHDHGHHGAVAQYEGDMTGDGQSPSELSVFQCSACAACCLGAAFPASPVVFASWQPRGTMMTTVATPALSFLTSGPDRPPRLPLV